jgi:phospholipid/cholesterol/gamma-HCH transport system ATP-binding protein
MGIKTNSNEIAIALRDLRKTFDGKDYVLDGINLEIPAGKITSIIGFSGTGKSVMMKHILGLLKPTSGVVEVLGHDLSKMTMPELIKMRTRIGMSFQYAALFDDMTVMENAEFPMKEHRHDLTPAQRSEIAGQKLLAVGMDPKHNQKLPGELSGGMRKRVALARALALDPDILLYDEPTTGLDPILTEVVDDLIYETHHKFTGSTSVVVSHDLFAAFRLSDYIVMLDKGGVLLAGRPEIFYESKDELVQRFLTKGFRNSPPPRQTPGQAT